MQQKDMTLILGVSASAVSRELSRNTGKHCPEETNAKALGCRKNAAKTLKMTQEVCAFIEEKIQLDYSLEQVSGWLITEKNIKISYERISQHVWANKRQGRELFKHLGHSNKKRKKQCGSKDKRGQIRNKVSIDERPEIVEQKARIGDWE